MWMFLALTLYYYSEARPTNWEAAIGVVQNVSFVNYPDGGRYVQLTYSDGRKIAIGNRILFGPKAEANYFAPCDQILSAEEVKAYENGSN